MIAFELYPKFTFQIIYGIRQQTPPQYEEQASKSILKSRMPKFYLRIGNNEYGFDEKHLISKVVYQVHTHGSYYEFEQTEGPYLWNLQGIYQGRINILVFWKDLAGKTSSRLTVVYDKENLY